MHDGPASDDLPTPGTAIVRPTRHVNAVRQRHAQQYADPVQATTARAARAWAWALGETTTAPVTSHRTTVPPGRADIRAEITAADDLRQRGNREDQADAYGTATVLRWLIGDDDRVPVHGYDRGELVGGSGAIVRSPDEIAAVLAAADPGRQGDGQADDQTEESQDIEYWQGATATLAWVLGNRPQSPLSRSHSPHVTSRFLKTERLHADDLIEQTKNPWMADHLPSPRYGEGVKATINWLLGAQTTPPGRSGWLPAAPVNVQPDIRT